MTAPRQENISSIMAEARAEFGNDFNARGLLAGLEESLEMTAFPPDEIALRGAYERNNTIPGSRDTDQGRKIGRLLGHALNVGSLNPTTEASNV